MTALLALVSAVLVGGADFVGGIASRTANGVRVAAFAQVVGLAFALPVSIAYGADRLGATDVGWSVLSGMAVGGGFGLFYTAMGRGLISVVAPVAAVTGAVLPVVYALARGERPGTTAVAGLVIALVAVAIVSIAPAEQHADAGVVDGVVIGLSIASGLFFGTFYIAFSQISDDAGLWPVTTGACRRRLRARRARGHSHTRADRGRAAAAALRPRDRRPGGGGHRAASPRASAWACRGRLRARVALSGDDRDPRRMSSSTSGCRDSSTSGVVLRPRCRRPRLDRVVASANDERVAGSTAREEPQLRATARLHGALNRAVARGWPALPPTAVQRVPFHRCRVYARTPLPGRTAPRARVVEPLRLTWASGAATAAIAGLAARGRLEAALPAIEAGLVPVEILDQQVDPRRRPARRTQRLRCRRPASRAGRRAAGRADSTGSRARSATA